MNAATVKQPMPDGGDTEILPLVLADLEARAAMGDRKFGQPMMTGDGRDSLADAYQEALDLVFYLRKEIEQRR